MYTVGLDYGTNSIRALLVRASDGSEVGIGIAQYSHGTSGVLLDSRNPDLARQHPQDYLDGAIEAMRCALASAAENNPRFSPLQVVGIGVDTTGSTPLPVDAQGRALTDLPRFANNPNAMAWLWKDHTATSEARSLTDAALSEFPQYLKRCGGAYSSEWFWSKIWHCAVVDPEVSHAAASWIELADWIPAILTGTESHPVRGICAAGHKGLYHESWGGFPSFEFLARRHPKLGELRTQLHGHSCVAVDQVAGTLTVEWAAKLGLQPGIPVAVGAIDAHLGAVGSGIEPGTLVKILGTSTCDMMVHPLAQSLADIPGICGIVPSSIVPGYYGLEAGQSAVGDLFNWFIDNLGPTEATHESLTAEASQLLPGESGLLALDWNNGNRTVLADQRLTGLLLGQTLATRPAHIYRALIEATAFGARIIMERFEEHGVAVQRVVTCGGIAEKSPLVMQVYADVTGRPMLLSRSSQTCALGAAITGAVAARLHPDIPAAQRAMTGIREATYRPNPASQRVYQELFKLYRCLHDAFGMGQPTMDMALIMKQLLQLRDRARSGFLG